MILFDAIKHSNEYGQEYRNARELFKILEYTEYTKFLPTIQKAKKACAQSGQQVCEHFAEVSEPQKSRNQYGETSGQLIDDIHLSRYACYLIAMEADSRKSSVALAKSYFAIQTRKQELNEQAIEDQKRVYLREQVSEHNKLLAKTAKSVGVTNYGNFIDYGYLGLYGMRNKEILKKKGLAPKTSLMDTIGSEELAANLFRATQAEAKIKRENIQGQNDAQKAHHTIGKEVRATIKKIGGTMPEELPPADHITQAKKRIKQNVKNLNDGN